MQADVDQSVTIDRLARSVGPPEIDDGINKNQVFLGPKERLLPAADVAVAISAVRWPSSFIWLSLVLELGVGRSTAEVGANRLHTESQPQLHPI